MSNEKQQTDLVITRVIDAPVAKVWKAWTDADMLKQWWGPNGFTCPVAQMDVREGGTSLVAMSSPDFGTSYSLWAHRTTIPNQQLEYIHNLADEHGNTIDPKSIGMPEDFPVDQRQLIEFKPTDDNKTELTITEYGWTEGQMMDMSKMGMEQCLDKLDALLKP